MALTANVNTAIREGHGFGYKVAAGIHVYAGALLMFNAAGTLQRPQDAAGVAFAGLADRELDNSSNTAASWGFVVARRGIVVALPVPAATFANIAAAIYATDDGTVSLSSNSGANPLIGNLVGFENGNTWVRIVS